MELTLEDKYKELVDLFPYGVLIQLEEKFIFANPAAVTIFAASNAKSLKNNNLLELVHPDDRKMVRRSLEDIRKLKVSAGLLEAKLLKFDNTIASAEITVIPIVIHEKPALQVVVRDTSYEWKLDAKLIKSEKNLLHAQKIAHLGSWELDFATNTLFWSEEACHIFGITSATKPSVEFFAQIAHPDDWANLTTAFTELIEQGKIFNVDHRIIMPNGAIHYVNEQGELTYDQDHKPIRFTGTVLDITERKLAELEVLKLNQKLEQRVIERTAQLEAANKELEAFTYSVSHDLRAPLRSIDGFSQALIEDYGNSLDMQAMDYLTRVRKASNNMAQLIDDMLTLSHVTRGDMIKEQVNLSNLVLELSDELQTNEPQRKVEFIIQPELKAIGDARLLRRMLENLLNNAWKFSAKQVKAHIQFGMLAMKQNGKPVFYLRDDGAGFDMSRADKLFGVFQRLHATQEFSGTGVGLAIAQRIVNRHGGEIWAESKVGKGATFYFALPTNKFSGSWQG